METAQGNVTEVCKTELRRANGDCRWGLLVSLPLLTQESGSVDLNVQKSWSEQTDRHDSSHKS